MSSTRASGGQVPCWRELAWQDDVVSRAQLLACGLTDSWVRARLVSGRWQQLLRGVYLARSGPVDYSTRVWAGVLYAGEGAAASHETAAFLHGLIDQQPAGVHLLVPAGRRVRAQPGLDIHRAVTVARARFSHRPPRTSIEATLLDLADAAVRPVDVVGLVTAALVRDLTHAVRLSQELATRRRVRWRGLINEILLDGDGIESPLEWRYRRDVERRHSLPQPLRQAPSSDLARTRRDVYYEAQRVVVELDGRRNHSGVAAFRDARRDNAAAVRGDLTLRYGWQDVVGGPCLVALQVATVLVARGWTGHPKPCGPSCALASFGQPFGQDGNISAL